MEKVKIMYDDDQLVVIDKINKILEKHNLTIEFSDPDVPKDGFEEVYIAESNIIKTS